MKTTQTTTPTADTISMLPLELLHPSPFNPRRTFRAIDELAENIKAEGRVLQPLLVRPRMVNPLRDDQTDGYEIVFGHRRDRAAELAGLTHVPCMVRAMTDQQAMRAQVSENLQREDVHPIEEAEGLQRLLDDGIKADDLAAQLGKSRSYVYGRLKLLQACPQVRDACLAGEVTAEVALLIARLRTDKLQAHALNHIKGRNGDITDGGAASFRQIRAMLHERYTLELSAALFDPEDASLVPDAGPCSSCPKLSGNAPEFADVAAQAPRYWRGDQATAGALKSCTDPDCFAGKNSAHLARQATAMSAAGKTVIDGNRARQAVGADGKVKGAFVALADVRQALKKAGTKAEVVTIQDPRTGKTVQAVKRADLQAAGVDVAPKSASRGSPSADRYAIEQKARVAKAQAETEARRRLLAQVRSTAAQRPRSADELRLVLAALLIEGPADWQATALLCQMHVGPADNESTGRQQQLMDQLPSMSPDALALLLLDLVLVRDCCPNQWELDPPAVTLDGLAGLYGIDTAAARAEPAPEPAPAPAASTPPPAARATAGAARLRPGIHYLDPLTGATWTGRGLQPAWLKARLAAGGTLDAFKAAAAAQYAAQKTAPAPAARAAGRAAPASRKKAPGGAKAARPAADEQMDGTGCAGVGAADRCPNTGDLFVAAAQ